MKNNNPYQRIIQLKQYTHILHFQHNQDGATLRATEVKPKLDRFLIERFKKENPGWEKWKVGGSKGQHETALDYKLTISDTGSSPEKKDFVIIPPDSKTGVLSQSAIKLTFFTLHPKLKEEIEKRLDVFFAIHNFGTRQNKGFGSFLPDKIRTNEDFENVLSRSGKAVYKYTGTANSSLNTFYKDISADWRNLKSGTNHNGYYKSLLFKYMSANGIRWEKRIIKQSLKHMIDNRLLPVRLKQNYPPVDAIPGEDKFEDDLDTRSSWTDNPNIDYNYHFVRVLLGLAEHYEFRAEGGYVYQVRIISEDGIDRFKAPITFKYFNKKIYAIAEPERLEGLSGTFKFEVQKKQRNNKVGNVMQLIAPDGVELKLSIPTNFNLIDFLNEYLICLDYERID